MLPVLGTVPGMQRVAAPYARDLGIAFQLTNFIRDVGEDLQRGRVYLPKDELALFGVTRDDLATGVVDANLRRLLAFQIARARELFRAAAPGIRLLEPTSRDCIRTAATLYGEILDEVEAADYRVLRDASRSAAAAAPRSPCRRWRGHGAPAAADPYPRRHSRKSSGPRSHRAAQSSVCL